MGEWRMDQVGEPKTAAPDTAPPLPGPSIGSTGGLSAGTRPGATAERKERLPNRVPNAGRRRVRRVAAAVVLLLVIGAAVGWYTVIRDPGPVPLSEVPLVRADHTPVRMQPEEPGGIDVPHLDRAVLHETDAGDGAAEIGAIAPPPEEPVVRPAPSVDTPAEETAAEVAGPDEPDSPPETAPAASTGVDGGDIQFAPLTTFSTPEALIDRVVPAAPVESLDPAGAPPADPSTPAEAPQVAASPPESLFPEGTQPAEQSADQSTSDAPPAEATVSIDDVLAEVTADPVPAGPAGPFLAAQLDIPPDSVSVQPDPVVAPAAAPRPAVEVAPILSQPEGESRIQVAAVDSEVVARQEWVRFQAQYPRLLGDLQLFVTTVEVNGRLFYRIQGGLLTEADAQDRCRSLQDLGADCIVR